MWNFKGYLWNSIQNILPIHWKMWILFTCESLRALRDKSSYAFLKRPPDHNNRARREILRSTETVSLGDSLISMWMNIVVAVVLKSIWHPTSFREIWSNWEFRMNFGGDNQCRCNVINCDCKDHSGHGLSQWKEAFPRKAFTHWGGPWSERSLDSPQFSLFTSLV